MLSRVTRRLAGKRIKFPNPLNDMPVPLISMKSAKSALDNTFDSFAYQLVLDGSISPVPTQWRLLDPSEQACKIQEMRHICSSKMEPRSEIRMCNLVIGCDEAGRGPIAGPVVASAFCRVPLKLLQSPENISSLQLPRESFPIFDSKKLTRPTRNSSFTRICGYDNFVSLAKSVVPVIHHNSGKKISNPLINLLMCKDSLVTSWAGRVSDVDNDFLHLWCIAMANHDYIDKNDILQASLTCMSTAAERVWNMLCQPAHTLINALPKDSAVVDPNEADPKKDSSVLENISSALRIFRGRCEDDDAFLKSSHEEIMLGPGKSTPLILVDGSVLPPRAVSFFTTPSVGGAVHTVVKGDARSYSIAAASILSKCARDSAMELLDAKFPAYGFAHHAGYPTKEHRAAVRKHGLCTVHRKSFRTKNIRKRPSMN